MTRFLSKLFGTTATARTAKPRVQPRFRPALESLDGRELPSTGGVISAITDVGGHTRAFTVGQNRQVFEDAGGGWYQVSNYGPNFKEVSAGLDPRQGIAGSFAIEQDSGRLWWVGLSSGDVQVWGSDDLWGGCTHISATRNGECFAIGTDSSVYVFNLQQHQWASVSFLSGFTQISAGVDQYGHDCVYAVDWTGHVAKYTNTGGGWQGTWLPIYAGQVSAGIGSNATETDVYFTNPWDQSLHYYDGSSDHPLGGGCLQISAGLDAYGGQECYVLGTNHAMYKNDATGWHGENGQWTQITTAKNDMAFAVTPVSNQLWVYDPDYSWNLPWWYYTRSMSNPAPYWSDTGGVSISPI
jgi:hypothetical protein